MLIFLLVNMLESQRHNLFKKKNSRDSKSPLIFPPMLDRISQILFRGLWVTIRVFNLSCQYMSQICIKSHCILDRNKILPLLKTAMVKLLMNSDNL